MRPRVMQQAQAHDGPASTSTYAESALRQAGLRAELQLSVLRGLFCTLVGLRFAWVHAAEPIPDPFARGGVFFPAIAAGVAYSAFVVWRIARGRDLPLGALAASVLLDAGICTLALSSNVAYPWPEYRGILFLPETVTFLLVILLAGSRVSPRLVLLGSAACASGLSLLVVLDLRANSDQVAYGLNEGSLYAILAACMAALSWVNARRTERLVKSAAEHGYKTARARLGLSSLLREQHDAMSLLSAVLFDANDLARASADPIKVAALRHDLDLLKEALIDIKQRAFGETVALDARMAVDVEALLARERALYERSVAPLRVSWDVAGPLAGLRIEGGERTLRRVILNLLSNAAEGDGASGAAHAWVRCSAQDGAFCLAVEDDGPGVGAGLELVSHKARGTGSGLAFVRSVVEGAGGSIELTPIAKGTRVMLRLPLDRTQLASAFALREAEQVIPSRAADFQLTPAARSTILERG